MHDTVDRVIRIFLFLFLTAAFVAGVGIFLGPFLEKGFITRSQFVGLIAAACAVYVTRWLLSGKLKL